MAKELTGMGRAFIHLAPHLARWVMPEIWSRVSVYYQLEEAEIELSWGVDNKIDIVDASIHFSCEVGMGADGYKFLTFDYDTWDGTLPPEFVEFMNEHFKRENGTNSSI